MTRCELGHDKDEGQPCSTCAGRWVEFSRSADWDASLAERDTLKAAIEQKIRDWADAETRMRQLDAGLPGSGYDKLADGYGTCADELSAALAACVPQEKTSDG